MLAEGALNTVRIPLSQFVRPGDGVVWGQGPGAPLGLVGALLEQRHEIGGARVFCGYSAGLSLQAEHADVLRFSALGAFGDLRHLARAGCLNVIPAHMSDLGRLLAEGRIPCDVVFVQVAPRDQDGNYSLGMAVQHLPQAIAAARVVLAEVNDQMPVGCGYRLPADQVDLAIPVSRPLVEITSRPQSAAARLIAKTVAGLVPDGATLQFGVGALPDGVLAALSQHRGLGIHSGLVTDSILDCPAIASPAARAPFIAGAAFGTRRLYDWMHRNPRIELHGLDRTHAPQALRGIDRLITINSALEVDLTGQVGAESIGGRVLGSVGGQVDFTRAANASPGGLAIIALESISRAHRSAITSRLSGPVTTPRSDVRYVVTEYGCADLLGLDLDERAEAMIQLAHPDARARLRQEYQDGNHG